MDGQYFRTGTRVVTWRDPGGCNAYEEIPPAKGAIAPSENHGVRHLPDSGADAPSDLAALRGLVDQFVLHYDGEGCSRRCFDVLQKRGLSAHFLLDVDGTLYQTLDLRERAYHATIANSRSIGIEIAHPGAFSSDQAAELAAWYQRDASGRPCLTLSEKLGDPALCPPNFIARPTRPDPVCGTINGHRLRQYDFTPEQYAALIKLTAALHRVFPLIKLDYPRDAKARLVLAKLPDADLARFQGVLGHFHIQTNKVDPGPAMQWDRLIAGARAATSP